MEFVQNGYGFCEENGQEVYKPVDYLVRRPVKADDEIAPQQRASAMMFDHDYKGFDEKPMPTVARKREAPQMPVIYDESEKVTRLVYDPLIEEIGKMNEIAREREKINRTGMDEPAYKRYKFDA